MVARAVADDKCRQETPDEVPLTLLTTSGIGCQFEAAYKTTGH